MIYNVFAQQTTDRFPRQKPFCLFPTNAINRGDLCKYVKAHLKLTTLNHSIGIILISFFSVPENVVRTSGGRGRGNDGRRTRLLSRLRQFSSASGKRCSCDGTGSGGSLSEQSVARVMSTANNDTRLTQAVNRKFPTSLPELIGFHINYFAKTF